jgi:GT2 family glycosyltransferase
VFGFCGGAALLRTEALRAIGGVPAHFFCYYEDTDTSWRLRLAGWRVLTVAAATADHVHGASSVPGSFRFHRWNERNRLLMLLRCAPMIVALREFARFAALTAVLPLRRRTGDLNFTVRLRLLVVAEVVLRLPATLAARWRIGRRATVGRSVVWRTWSGR